MNAHAPTSVLLAVPLARMAFPDAFLVWNLISLGALVASLWLVQHQLRIPISAWSVGPLVALLLLCFPLWEQCRLGQLTLILLLLIAGAWAADRSGRPWLAGMLLGIAAAIKLFPSFLLFYYALRRRWRSVAAGILTIGALSVLTAAALGFDSYRDYFFNVLPEIQWFRVGWNNNSVWGFAARCSIRRPSTCAMVSHGTPLLQPSIGDVSVADRVHRPGRDPGLGSTSRREEAEGRPDLRVRGHGHAHPDADLLGALPAAHARPAGGGLGGVAGDTLRKNALLPDRRRLLARIPGHVDGLSFERQDGQTAALVGRALVSVLRLAGLLRSGADGVCGRDNAPIGVPRTQRGTRSRSDQS